MSHDDIAAETEGIERALRILISGHRFTKALGQCGCGWQHEPRGHREDQHRLHLADVLAAKVADLLAEARAEERERVAQAIDDEAEHYDGISLTAACEAAGMHRAAFIARNPEAVRDA